LSARRLEVVILCTCGGPFRQIAPPPFQIASLAISLGCSSEGKTAL
jgi:hypothetical protein